MNNLVVINSTSFNFYYHNEVSSGSVVYKRVIKGILIKNIYLAEFFSVLNLNLCENKNNIVIIIKNKVTSLS